MLQDDKCLLVSWEGWCCSCHMVISVLFVPSMGGVFNGFADHWPACSVFMFINEMHCSDSQDILENLTGWRKEGSAPEDFSHFNSFPLSQFLHRLMGSPNGSVIFRSACHTLKKGILDGIKEAIKYLCFHSSYFSKIWPNHEVDWSLVMKNIDQ